MVQSPIVKISNHPAVQLSKVQLLRCAGLRRVIVQAQRDNFAKMGSLLPEIFMFRALCSYLSHQIELIYDLNNQTVSNTKACVAEWLEHTGLKA